MTIDLVRPSSLQLHPQAGLVPEMPAEQYRVFLKDVRDRLAIDEPLKRIPGTAIVIDGRTRLKASLEAGLAVIPVTDADLGHDSPLLYMLRVAYLRRNLKPAQAAKLGHEIKKLLAAEMRQRKRDGARRGGEESGRSRRGEESKLAVNRPQASHEPEIDTALRAALTSRESPDLSFNWTKRIAEVREPLGATDGYLAGLISEAFAGGGTATTPGGTAYHWSQDPSGGPNCPALWLGSSSNGPPRLTGDAILSAVRRLYSVGVATRPTAEVRKARAPGAREQAATLAGTSPKAIAAAAAIEQKSPEVYARMGTGEIPTIAEAKRAAGIEPVKLAKLLPKSPQVELLPCPFCGSAKLAEKPLLLGMRAMQCQECYARGPEAAEPVVARERWNKRSAKHCSPSMTGGST